MTAKHPMYTLAFEALPDPAAKIDPKFDRDADNRLKLMLKHALRTWGFKCCSAAGGGEPSAGAGLPRWDVMGDAVGRNDVAALTAEEAAENFVRWLFDVAADVAADAMIESPTQRVTVRPHGQAEPVAVYDAMTYCEVLDVVLYPGG